MCVLTLIVTCISPGSQVVRLPSMISTSLLACVGSIFRDESANSSAFCNEGSPPHCEGWLNCDCNADKSLRPFPANSTTLSALLLRVDINPNWLIGFWSKNSSTNPSKSYNKKYTVNTFLFIRSKINEIYSFTYFSFQYVISK